MKVKIQHSIEFDEIIDFLLKKLEILSNEEKKHCVSVDYIKNLLFTGRNSKCLEEIEKQRQFLANMDTILNDCQNILVGYEEISFQIQKAKLQQEQNNNESEQEQE